MKQEQQYTRGTLAVVAVSIALCAPWLAAQGQKAHPKVADDNVRAREWVDTIDEHRYFRPIIVRRVYDADTVHVDIDLGLGIFLHSKAIRLYGINAPEIRGPEKPEGLKSKRELLRLIESSDIAVLQTFNDKSGKYGRLLGTIWLHIDGEWMNANRHLVEYGFAKVNFYDGR